MSLMGHVIIVSVKTKWLKSMKISYRVMLSLRKSDAVTAFIIACSACNFIDPYTVVCASFCAMTCASLHVRTLPRVPQRDKRDVIRW